MSAAPPSFLSDAPAVPLAARFAVFGKHPSAADHLPDLGLTTPSLVAFKQGFYTDGISTCLARQVWSKQVPTGTAVPYDHCLLAVGTGGWIAARFRESTDTSGRHQFPLVAALQAGNGELLSAAPAISAWLDEAHSRLAAASDLKSIHLDCQNALAGRVAGWEKMPPFIPGVRAAWADDAALGPARQGLQRVCHVLAPDGAGSSRARVPLPGGNKAEAVVLWASWLRHFLPARPVSLIWQPSASHADVAFGVPDAASLAPIFASLSDVPLTSTVPFSIAPPFVERTGRALQEWLGESSMFPTPPPPPGNASFADKIRSWFGQ